MIVSMKSWAQIDEFVRGPERVYRPTDYSGSNSYPLVILLHAYGMDTAQAESIWGLAESVDRYQSVYAIFYEFHFKLIDSLTNEFALVFSREIPLR